VDGWFAYPSAAGNLIEYLVQGQLLCTSQGNRLVSCSGGSESANEAGADVADENWPIERSAIAGNGAEQRRLAHRVHHLGDKAIAGAEDERGPQDAIGNPAVPDFLLAQPLAGLIACDSVSPHSQRRHVHKTFDAPLLRRLDDMAGAEMMYSLECVLAFFDDDANQMDNPLTALYALVDSNARDDITLNVVHTGWRRLVCPTRIANQRTYAVAFRQKLRQDMPAHKTRGACKEDSHR
jgi:hypothetical protein